MIVPHVVVPKTKLDELLEKANIDGLDKSNEHTTSVDVAK